VYTSDIEGVLADAYAAGEILYPEFSSDLFLPAKADAIYSLFLKRPVYGDLKKNLGELGQV